MDLLEFQGSRDQLPGVCPPGLLPRDAPDGLLNLPTLPAIAMRMLQLVAQEDTEFFQVLEAVRSDPGCAAELLAMANSPLFALRGRISTLGQAIIYLGLERTRSTILALVMRSFLQSLGNHPEYRTVWKHSVATAWIAQSIAGRGEAEAQDVAYTTGLLHDLGRLGMLKVYGKKYAHLLGMPHADASALREAEQNAFGLSHCEAGYWLAKTWNIPDTLQLSILEHHRGPGLSSIACQLANAAGYPCIPYHRPVAVEDIWKRLNPNTSAWLCRSFGDMQEELRKHLEMFA